MDPKPFTGGQLFALSFVTGISTFMQVLDTSIANVAIPSIAGDLGVSANQGTWIITSFAAANAIVIPLTGWLSKSIGEVKLFIFSVILFTLFSFLCGFAPTFELLVIFRVLQGAVSGPIMPLSQSILLQNFPLNKRDFALSIWAMITVVGPVLGPILGGWITDNYGWSWIFYINVPFGIICAIMGWGLLHKRETQIFKQKIDLIGLSLLVVGIASLQILLDKGYDLAWFESPVIKILGVIACLSLSYFIVWTMTSNHPVVDLTLLKRRNFLLATFNVGVTFVAIYGGIVIFPLWLQMQMGYTPTWAGVASAPIGILPIFISPLMGRYGKKVDARILVTISCLIFIGTFYWQSTLDTDASFEQLASPRLVQGAALVMFYLPLMTLALVGIPKENTASATGLFNFVRTMGISIGTSIFTTLWYDRAIFHHSRLIEEINTFNPPTNEMLEQLRNLGFTGRAPAAVINEMVTNQAFMLSTNDVFWVSAFLFFPLIGFAWLCKPRPTQ